MTTVTLTAELLRRIRSGEGRVWPERVLRMSARERAMHEASLRISAASAAVARCHSEKACRAVEFWGAREELAEFEFTEEEVLAHWEAELASARVAFWAAHAMEG